MRAAHQRGRPDRGSVTAEAAVLLPVLLIVLGAALWAVAIVGVQLQCVDAARAGARAAARGEVIDEVRRTVLRAVPAGARVEVIPGTETTRVEVVAVVEPFPGAVLPPVRVTAAAVSATEPGVVP
ncbi:hypothetical protein TBS_20310 [Thermobispora bispora]|uniref:TadE family type IV pilus minor pilin n=1 Tax=Thermobispora bispora TaxID=2006 RepID=UPI0003237B91|nr:TadE family type IV pilus minor pilin [Thermobispora bispora]MBO2474504.1 hypothetical protein [Actinomycetales bacterium]MDI9580862.1 TadE family type IV pilus minor pilin [Thermobispora sp.]QSI46932.1 hypothetical protein CYL17_02980 [Thermobispora bispora]